MKRFRVSHPKLVTSSTALFLLLLIGASALLFLQSLPAANTAEQQKNEVPAEVEQALNAPEQAILFSLEPDNRPAVTHGDLFGFRILGQTKLDSAQTTTAVGAFHAAVSGWDGRIASCFEPRHALRITSQGHTYDLLLCYGCHQLYIYRDKALLTSIGAAGSSEVLNRLLTDAKVPLAYAESKEGKEAQRRIAEDQQREYEDSSKRWLAGMPQSIRPLWDFNLEPYDGPKLKPLHEAIAREFPDFGQRSAALFRWYGSSEGSWSRSYGWEEIAQLLLLDIPTGDLIRTAERNDLTEAQIDGAARFFAGIEFSSRRPKDLKPLSNALKKKLLTHCLRSKDETKILEGREAFGK